MRYPGDALREAESRQSARSGRVRLRSQELAASIYRSANHDSRPMPEDRTHANLPRSMAAQRAALWLQRAEAERRRTQRRYIVREVLRCAVFASALLM